ncbi:MAG: ABC transporter permease [Planctomycetia bacterium]|nr:ABC transporter permease [Planctomycetia bacterium]
MTPIWHVAWKEYRLLRSLWLTFFALAMLLQVTALMSVSRSYASSREFVTVLFALTVWLPAFYALGCGATMFAAEKDDGTYEWLRVLPIDGLRVFAGKLLFAVPSTGLLFLAVVLITRSFGRGVMPPDEITRQLCGAWGVAALEALAWGALISLISRRPLLSAVIAAAVGSTVTHMIVASFVDKFWTLEAYTSALPARLVIVAVVFAVDLILARGWLANPRPARVRSQPIQNVVRRSSTTGLGPRWRRILRLCWQDWRQSRRAVAGYCVVAVIAGFVVGRFLIFGLSVGSAAMLAAASLSAFLCTLVGATTFRGDHEDSHYRFLAEHAISPRDVWWARELFWGTVALICGLACILAVFAWNTSLGTHSYARSQILESAIPDSLLEAMFCYLALPFIAGQFASLLLRSPLLPATAGIALAGALMAWAMLMAQLSIAWWWTVLPLAVALLIATRMRLSDWLTYRDGWRKWLRIAGTVLVPIALVAAGVIWFRVHEIPAVVNGVALTGDPFDLADYDRMATEEENKTALLYVEAWNSYHDYALDAPPAVVIPTAAYAPNARVLAAERRGILELNAEPLQWMLSATQRADCVLRRPSSASLIDMPGVAKEANKLAGLLIVAGQLAEHDGKLDEALDYYLRARRFAQHIARFGNHSQCLQAALVDNLATNAIVTWADRPGQSNELLERALEAVRSKRMVDLLADAPKTEYLMTRRAIESGSFDMPASISPRVDAVRIASAGASRFPWERARQLRLLRLATYWAMHFPQGSTANLNINTPWAWLRREPLSSRPNQALRQLIGDSSYAQHLVPTFESFETWAGGTYVNAEHHLQNAIERTRYGTNAPSTPFAEPDSEGFAD